MRFAKKFKVLGFDERLNLFGEIYRSIVYDPEFKWSDLEELLFNKNDESSLFEHNPIESEKDYIDLLERYTLTHAGQAYWGTVKCSNCKEDIYVTRNEAKKYMKNPRKYKCNKCLSDKLSMDDILTDALKSVDTK